MKSPLAKRSSIFLPSFSAIQTPSSLPLPSPPPPAKPAALSSTPNNPSQRERLMMRPPRKGMIRPPAGHHNIFAAQAKRVQFVVTPFIGFRKWPHEGGH